MSEVSGIKKEPYRLRCFDKRGVFLSFYVIKKAADGNRTRDLRTTNATLYRLSHSSKFYALLRITECYITIY